ncbi:hypothetical protein [Parazoarcus communis]|uniref:Uncharacterized protein n=1 Tax=Parazoarcus communis SWub3 = DSM 12120 TaxID=1121029 RepID=A0A323UQ45_9RHOO|nr:hypothetical protein [Parazoarcus communis]NMG72041.1 hypothetical protein [Parazoarcus communis SWub3 = DSM 12120]PZA14549.1 hypothetical protein DNK49_21075 [Azoarcus communis] [Parazoarcus communis SWub3 = DSM 12120]
MNPETVTTSQIIGGFTAKHWVAAITTTFAGIGALTYGGYWAGQRVAESQSLAQQADLKAINAQVQAKLEVTQAQLQTALAATAQLKDLLDQSHRTIEDKSNEVAKLTEALGRSNNCAFVHQQIIDTKRELEGTGSMVVFDASQEWQEKQKARKVALEQRLYGYQQQLGTCNK